MALPLNQLRSSARCARAKRAVGWYASADFTLLAILLAAIVQLNACAGYVGAGTAKSSGASSAAASNASPALQVNPTSVNFGTVVVGAVSTQPVTLMNSGAGNLTISQANVSGSGFGMSGLTLPVTLSAGQSVGFSVSFSSGTTGVANGSLNVMSNASGTPSTLPLSASVAAAAPLLSANPTSVN